MEKPKTSKKFLKTYLYTEKFGNFFVSTCYRVSSVMMDPPPWYYETFAWRLDKDNNRTEWVVELAGVDDENLAVKDHMDVVYQLNLKGEYPKEEENNNG